MSKFNNKKVLPRYVIIASFMTLVALAVLGKSAYIMLVQKDYWLEVASKQKNDSLPIRPTRGNILSANGELMASSLPEFKIYMDFVTLKETGKDTAFVDSIDYICKGLGEIFPEKTVGEFKEYLLKGLKEQRRHYPIWKYSEC